MIRRFNFTGRRKIPRDRISLTIEGEEAPAFNVQWNFEGLRIPEAGHVFVEAYAPGSVLVERYDFGTVGTPVPPVDRALNGLSPGDVRFNLKVVDEYRYAGRLLAVALALEPRRPATDDLTGTLSILPIQSIDLVDQVWRIRFDDIEDGRPVLQVNSRIETIMEDARHNRTFFALVYPQVVRDILSKIIIDEEFDDPDGEDPDWQRRWIRWGIAWHPDRDRPPSREADDDGVARRHWVEEVASAFCTKHRVRERYITPVNPEAHQ
jgi:hypothetical protein